MITEQDLREAIAECVGQRNPNANTAIKLAAFYIILDHLHDEPEKPKDTGYSFASGPEMVIPTGDSEFFQSIKGKNTKSVLEIMDDLMDAVSVMYPNLYHSTLDRLRDTT